MLSEGIGAVARVPTDAALSCQIHFAKALFKILVGRGLQAFERIVVDRRNHPIEVEAIGQAVAKLVGAIPSIFGYVTAYVQRAEFRESDFAHHTTRDGHYLNFEKSRNLAAGNRENKLGGSGKWIWIIHHISNHRFVHYLETNAVIYPYLRVAKCPGSVATFVLCLNTELIATILWKRFTNHQLSCIFFV